MRETMKVARMGAMSVRMSVSKIGMTAVRPQRRALLPYSCSPSERSARRLNAPSKVRQTLSMKEGSSQRSSFSHSLVVWIQRIYDGRLDPRAERREESDSEKLVMVLIWGEVRRRSMALGVYWCYSPEFIHGHWRVLTPVHQHIENQVANEP
jgi:hypothetical protein